MRSKFSYRPQKKVLPCRIRELHLIRVLAEDMPMSRSAIRPMKAKKPEEFTFCCLIRCCLRHKDVGSGQIDRGNYSNEVMAAT